MAHVDFIPTFQDAKEMRAYGYTGPAQLDKVLRWFRDEQNIHINPVYSPAHMGYNIKVVVLGGVLPQSIDFSAHKRYQDFYAAAWVGISRAKFYINNHHRDEKTKQVRNTLNFSV